MSEKKRTIALGLVFLACLALAYVENVFFFQYVKDIFSNPPIAVMVVFIHNVLAISLIFVGMSFYVEFVLAFLPKQKYEYLVLQNPRLFAFIFTIMILLISIFRAGTLIQGQVVINTPPPNSYTIPPQTTSEVVNLLIAMKNNAKAESTIKTTSKSLKRISKHADLHNPEQVKAYIASLHVCNGTKNNLCIIYNSFCKHYKIQWEMPKYKPEPKSIKIPTREKLEMIIASSGKTLATKLTISKETGLRPIELCRLKVKDIDLDQRLITPTTAKNGNPRTLKISNSLQRMIQDHIIRNNLNQNDKLFRGKEGAYTKLYARKRNILAKKLKDPSLRQIRLYDFRHFFATTLYHKTRDILFVKQQMGHKRIETTLIYTQLLNLNDDEWTCKATTNTNEATELIENGFEYVTTTPDALMLFRKRK